MPLTPCHSDPNRAKELERRKANPGSFGVGREKSNTDAAKNTQPQQGGNR